MFKIGDRVVVVAAQPPSGEYKNGDKGTVVDLSYQEQWVDVKIDGSDSLYDTMYFSEVQKDTPLNSKDKTTPSFQAGENAQFKVGDKIKFTESSLASGMIDAKGCDVFTVKESYKRAVTLKELEGCYHVTHFEHVKEEVMNNTEEQEIKWEVGQEVWCLFLGKGVVIEVDRADTKYPVEVDFGNGINTVHYTVGGKYYFDGYRTLFFSEPKIEAEKFPPKKTFVATLKEGDIVVVKHKRLEDKAILTVEQEDEDVVWFKEKGVGYCKTRWNFFKIGEEVEFK